MVAWYADTNAMRPRVNAPFRLPLAIARVSYTCPVQIAPCQQQRLATLGESTSDSLTVHWWIIFCPVQQVATAEDSVKKKQIWPEREERRLRACRCLVMEHLRARSGTLKHTPTQSTPCMENAMWPRPFLLRDKCLGNCPKPFSSEDTSLEMRGW